MNAIWTHSTSRSGDACVVVLSGELELSGRDDLIKILLDAVKTPGTAAVHVDLGAVDFLDSSGMAALMAAHHIATATDRTFSVVRASPHVTRALDVAGVLGILSPERV
jgi:anti-sigma B factor antagonist